MDKVVNLLSKLKCLNVFTQLTLETSTYVFICLLSIVGFGIVYEGISIITLVSFEKEELSMTDRQQAYYDYLETKEHNRRTEDEQKRHNAEVERLTAENQAEAARAHKASEALQSEANAIQRNFNVISGNVAQQNADTNSRNADTNARQADVAESNSETQKEKVFNDFVLGSRNYLKDLMKIRLDDENTKKNLSLTATRDQNTYNARTRELDQAQGRLDLAWQEYAMNKNDKTWNNVLRSVQTFNSTADTWAKLLGVAAPSTSIKINRNELNGTKWNGTIKLRDVAKLYKNLIR